MTNRKFYKTVVQVVVLSEEPLPEETDIDDLHYRITEGCCSGIVSRVSHEELNGKQAADALAEQFSDPSFFQLTEDGCDL